MLDWVKVYWHCLSNFHKNFKGEYHQMCESSVITIMKNGKRIPSKTQHFCSCGYMNGGTNWEKLKKDLDTIRKNQ